jgi:cysteate synthase
MKDAGGDFFAVTNQEAMAASELFATSEGADIEPAAAVAVASLIKAVEEGKVEKDATIMLNITGGGIQRIKREKSLCYLKPSAVFPIGASKDEIKAKLTEIFA